MVARLLLQLFETVGTHSGPLCRPFLCHDLCPLTKPIWINTVQSCGPNKFIIIFGNECVWFFSHSSQQ